MGGDGGTVRRKWFEGVFEPKHARLLSMRAGRLTFSILDV